tara:strand:+ start:10532 stop:11134 length:603 start_codon:yes stop_codon:yes gene_type:complete
MAAPRKDRGEFSDDQFDELVEGLKEVKTKTNVKRPTYVKVVEEPVVAIDEDTLRKLEKEEDRSKDSIIRTMRGNPSDPKILAAAAEELADEIHSLKWERKRLEQKGRDIANTSGRRVTALKALIDTSIKLKELSTDAPVDFASPQLKIIINLLFGKVKSSLEEAGYTTQDVNSFFQVLQTNMQSFEVEAQRLIDQQLKDK